MKKRGRKKRKKKEMCNVKFALDVTLNFMLTSKIVIEQNDNALNFSAAIFGLVVSFTEK